MPKHVVKTDYPAGFCRPCSLNMAKTVATHRVLFVGNVDDLPPGTPPLPEERWREFDICMGCLEFFESSCECLKIYTPEEQAKKAALLQPAV
jgi:hypothetical protein